MSLIKKILSVMLLGVAATTALAHEHENFFYAAHLDVDAGVNNSNDEVFNWDLDTWLGSDEHKLRIKSEGEMADSHIERDENWLLYSYNFDTFWDMQAGVRYDSDPESATYFAAGFSGLAPYYINTDVFLLLGEGGNMRLNTQVSKDFLFTQQWILQPYAELNTSSQEMDNQRLGSGITDVTAGLQLRYEITRKFAPYIRLETRHLLGDTADMADNDGDDRRENTLTAGMRLLF